MKPKDAASHRLPPIALRLRRFAPNTNPLRMNPSQHDGHGGICGWEPITGERANVPMTALGQNQTNGGIAREVRTWG